MKTQIIILGIIALMAGGCFAQANNTEITDKTINMNSIEFIPKEFHDVKLGFNETSKNPCSPNYPLYASDFLRNAITINVPEKIICNISDSAFFPIIPVCVAYVIGEKRGLKYAHLSTPVIHIRKTGEETGFSGEVVEPPYQTLDDGTIVYKSPDLPPDYYEEEEKRQQRIKEAQKYSDEEIDEKEGQGIGGFLNVNLMEYVDMPFEPGKYEIYLSFSGLESNRVFVEIIFQGNIKNQN